MQNCETSPGPPSEAICGRDFVKDIEPQRIYIKLQFSRVANILQPSRWLVSEEIQAICQFFAWPRFPCICCWARMARLAAHFVVNLEQIEVNIFPLFTLLPSFLLLLSQTAHGNLVALIYIISITSMIFMKITSKHQCIPSALPPATYFGVGTVNIYL